MFEKETKHNLSEVLELDAYSTKTLELIVNFLKSGYIDRKSKEKSDPSSGRKVPDFSIIPDDVDTLMEMLLAVNQLDIQPLLDLITQKTANMIKGKSPKQICAIFGETEPFTPAEEEKVYKDNPWLRGV